MLPWRRRTFCDAPTHFDRVTAKSSELGVRRLLIAAVGCNIASSLVFVGSCSLPLPHL
jgi:hypothetical protein